MVQKSGLPVEIGSFFPLFTRGFLHPRWFSPRISEPSTVVWRLGFQPKHSKFIPVFSKSNWTVTQNTPQNENIHLTNHCFAGYVWFNCFMFADYTNKDISFEDKVAFTFQPLGQQKHERLDLGGGNSNMLFFYCSPRILGVSWSSLTCAHIFFFRWGWNSTTKWVFPKNMGTPKWMGL